MPICPNCGTYSEPGKKFCTECGQRLPDEPEQSGIAVEDITDKPEDTVETPVNQPEPEVPAEEKPEENKEEQQTPAWQIQYQQYRQNNQTGNQTYQNYQNNGGQTYTPPPEDTAPANSGKGIGIVSLIFGILGLICCFIPVFSLVGLITGIVGVTKGGKAPAKVGLILSIIALAFFVLAVIITIINGGSDFNIFNRINDYLNQFSITI